MQTEDLLTAAGEMRDQLVLVGHSMGGMNIQSFFGLNRTRVAGVVFVDAVDINK